jgi:hypothetical protein
MKKIILFLLMSLMVGTLIACTAESNNEDEADTEEINQEGIKDKTNEEVKEIQNDNWELSPTFEHSIIDKEGKEISYTIVGNKETLGFTGDISLNSEKIHKLFWFYCGEENIYDKPVEVKAIKKGTEEVIDLHSGTFYKGAEVSADSVNMPSNLQFQSSGIWKILVYIDGEFYESIVVEVD